MKSAENVMTASDLLNGRPGVDGLVNNRDYPNNLAVQEAASQSAGKVEVASRRPPFLAPTVSESSLDRVARRG